MRLLFVHQSFPGQYRHILRALAAQKAHQTRDWELKRLQSQFNGVTYLRYKLSRGNTSGLHEWLLDFDSKLIRGEACSCCLSTA